MERCLMAGAAVGQSEQNRHFSRHRPDRAAILVAGLALVSYWVTLGTIYSIGVLRSRTTPTVSRISRTKGEQVQSIIQDPLFHALPHETRRRILSVVDPEFAALSLYDQYEVLAVFSRDYGAKPELVTAIQNEISGSWYAPREHFIEDIAVRAGYSIPYGLALTAVVAIMAVGCWASWSISRPRLRQVVIAGGVVLAFATTVYPPWVIKDLTGSGHMYGAAYAYGWLFSPPTSPYTAAAIDWSRLFLAWLLAGGVTAIGVRFLGRRAPQRANIERSDVNPVG